jgi:hypothetical protein
MSDCLPQPVEALLHQLKTLECDLAKSPQDTATLKALMQTAITLNTQAIALHDSGQAGIYTPVILVLCGLLHQIINRLLGLVQRSELINNPLAQMENGGLVS